VCTQWFNFIDSDNDGMVSPPELQRAMSQGGLHYSLQTVANMIRNDAASLRDLCLGCLLEEQLFMLHGCTTALPVLLQTQKQRRKRHQQEVVAEMRALISSFLSEECL
jgi:hypothetical protein